MAERLATRPASSIAEDLLRASKARWRSIFEHSIVGIGDRPEEAYLSALDLLSPCSFAWRAG